MDSDFVVPDGANIDRDVYVDTASTRVERTSSGPIITIDSPARVVVESVRVASLSPVMAFDISTGADVTLNMADISRGDVAVGGAATLRVTRSRFSQASIDCQSRVEVDESTFESGSRVSGNFCAEANIHHNRFLIAAGQAVAMANSNLRIENNLIWVEGSVSPEIAMLSTASPQGSTIRFNTFASERAGTGSALTCGAGDTVSSNVFAWQSPNPIYGTVCPVTYSLFDVAAGNVSGTGNVSGVPITDLFVAPDAGDFHPKPTSSALQAAEDGLGVPDDLEHQPRPSPTGTAPDIGAFEVP